MSAQLYLFWKHCLLLSSKNLLRAKPNGEGTPPADAGWPEACRWKLSPELTPPRLGGQDVQRRATAGPTSTQAQWSHVRDTALTDKEGRSPW